ncbi:MAG: UDP-N-acetylmuramoyl-L-alanyl-D-glutamate--2,6-diaminopimelate ligase [Christensenellales bacterium]|jgi:UDP-N-acetylmuramoyl-L-alanyl-D-glutamate--2,6-diaminopimelate ligase
MKLQDLLKNVQAHGVAENVEISGITADSRKVKAGNLFIALEGGAYDGHDFVKQAFQKGAAAAVTSKKTEESTISVRDTREAYAAICSNYYKNPEKKLKLIAVVGTNGKTTTAHIIKHILNCGGIKTASIGTLGFRIGEEVKDCGLTTPDPDVLYKSLAEAVQQDVKVVVMEVSAHAIYFKKVSGLRFDIGIFTNISQDHLDFFGDVGRYADVKKSFFNKSNVKFAVINTDDDIGRVIFENTSSLKASYGIKQPSDVFAIDIEQDTHGSKFVVNAFDIICEIDLPLPGIYNIYNTLAAISAALSLKVPIGEIKRAITGLQPPEGRFNVINADKMVIIDYAHTPDGLENLLRAAQMFKKNRIITVFGCGGNRDKAKRPIMGAIAQKYSDLVILTSDNPRFEEPEDIISDIAAGMKKDGYVCEQDRSLAIKLAITLANKEDIIVIAGKGGEDYLDIKGKKIPYSDIEEVKKHLEVKCE